MIDLSKRKFLIRGGQAAATLFCAPAIVRAESLMKIWVPPQDIYPIIRAPFIAIVHPDAADDLRNMAGFVRAEEYARVKHLPGEFGSLHGSRFVETGYLVDEFGEYHTV